MGISLQNELTTEQKAQIVELWNAEYPAPWLIRRFPVSMKFEWFEG